MMTHIKKKKKLLFHDTITHLFAYTLTCTRKHTLTQKHTSTLEKHVETHSEVLARPQTSLPNLNHVNRLTLESLAKTPRPDPDQTQTRPGPDPGQIRTGRAGVNGENHIAKARCTANERFA